VDLRRLGSSSSTHPALYPAQSKPFVLTWQVVLALVLTIQIYANELFNLRLKSFCPEWLNVDRSAHRHLNFWLGHARYGGPTRGHHQISNSIESIGERIRSNIAAANGANTTDPVTKAAVIGTGYLLTTTFTTEQAIPASSIWPPAVDCLKVQCSPTQRETYDLLAWRAQLKQSMPGGAGNISGDSHNGFSVTVMWFDKTSVQGDDAQFIDTSISNEVCPATRSTPNPAADRFCCPASVGAPDGVRCYNSKILP
jgi:type IV pilus assembly protein PilV